MSIKSVGALALLAAAIFVASLLFAAPAGAQSSDSTMTTPAPADNADTAAVDVSAEPMLALTGPGALTFLVASGMLLVVLGSASLIVGRRSEI